MAELSKVADRNEGTGRGWTTATATDFRALPTTMLVRVLRLRGTGGDIGHAITRHRHWRRRVDELTLRRRRRLHWFGTIAPFTLAAAKALEAIAWRRLLRMRARHADDARQKVLYLMSVSIGEGVTLSSRDIDLIDTSLRGFETELAALLRKPDR